MAAFVPMRLPWRAVNRIAAAPTLSNGRLHLPTPIGQRRRISTAEGEALSPPAIPPSASGVDEVMPDPGWKMKDGSPIKWDKEGNLVSKEDEEVRMPRAVQAIYLKPLRRQAEFGVPSCNLQLRSYSIRNVEFFAEFALRAAYYLGLPAYGPVPLPRLTETWTVPKANFIHKKSQENFRRITLRRLIQIKDGHPETVQVWLAFLKKHSYYGIGMKANVWEYNKLDLVKAMDDSMVEMKEEMKHDWSEFAVVDGKRLSVKQSQYHEMKPAERRAFWAQEYKRTATLEQRQNEEEARAVVEQENAAYAAQLGEIVAAGGHGDERRFANWVKRSTPEERIALMGAEKTQQLDKAMRLADKQERAKAKRVLLERAQDIERLERKPFHPRRAKLQYLAERDEFHLDNKGEWWDPDYNEGKEIYDAQVAAMRKAKAQEKAKAKAMQ